MRAAFYQGARTFTTGTTAVPAPAPGEALLRTLRVGICGTDLHIFQGHLDHRVPRGGIIGHETLAQVVEAPAGSGFSTGDRVVVEPLRFCGTCRACRMGASYLCYGLKVLGVDLPGGRCRRRGCCTCGRASPTTMRRWPSRWPSPFTTSGGPG
jgi:(R,R)-butanediol dehydrogenase/meso-butanediol dehydrogenase/diacetyl reductase